MAADTVRVGDAANPAGLRDAILTAYKAGAKRVVIAPGKYILPGGNDRASLALHDLKNLEIEAHGVDLAIQDTGKDAVGLYGCHNVTLRGATVHYTVPHTGQGKILNIGHDDTGNYYEVQLDAGYPQDADFKSAYIMEGNSRRIKPGTWDMGAKSVQPQANGQVRLYLNGQDGMPPKWNVGVGDYIVCRGPGAMMMHLDGCEHCTLQDITLYWSGVFGFFDTGGGVANRYLHDTITYGPAPPGATHAPLLSQSADGLHCAEASVGPDIENCSFAGMPDDGIAIHGSYELVAQGQGITLIVGTKRGQCPWQIGDPIRVQNDKTGLIADARVTAVAASDFTTMQKSSYRPFSDATLHYFQLTLDRAIEAPFDSLAANPARCGAGFKIIGNTIMNHRARGMLLKADGGLIQNNTIDGSSIAGIVVSPETWWGEAGYSHNITIIGNTIRHTNYAMTGPWYPQAAAVSITGEGSMGNQNIKIINNTFEDIKAANLMVRWAQDVTIQGNRFLNSHREPNKVGAVGKDKGVDASTVVWLGDCRNVTLSNNHVRGLGPEAKSVITITPTATNITGQEIGLKRR